MTRSGSALVVVVACGALGGCTGIYDAQLDDRMAELESFRTEFLPATERVQFIAGSEAKVYWVSLDMFDKPLLHSFDTLTSVKLDYEFSRGDTNIKDHFHLSDQLVVKCNFGTSTAFDANMSNQTLGTTVNGSDICSAEGPSVYFSVDREIRKWTPGAEPVKVIDIDTALGTGATTIDAFAVLGNKALLDEGPRLWLANVDAGTATRLDNADPATGTVDFDERGVLFESQKGVEYIAFGDHSTFVLEDAIADGGYDLNFKHSDLQTLADGGGFSLDSGHVIYQGSGGIFAYGLDSKKVVDLLLDKGAVYDAAPFYGAPVVTTNGTLFVQDTTQQSSNSPRPVYRVDLSGRLR